MKCSEEGRHTPRHRFLQLEPSALGRTHMTSLIASLAAENEDCRGGRGGMTAVWYSGRCRHAKSLR